VPIFYGSSDLGPPAFSAGLEMEVPGVHFFIPIFWPEPVNSGELKIIYSHQKMPVCRKKSFIRKSKKR
jgi:hypothetical protein